MEAYTENNLQTAEKRNGFRSFYIFPILYVMSAYLLPVFFLIGEEDSGVSCLVYLPVILGVVNIIVSILFCKPENRMMMLNAAVLVKYSLIPFFIVGGFMVCASLLLSFIPVPFMIFAGPMMAGIASFIGWLIVAFGAPYVISYLRLSSGAGMHSKSMVVIHSILQFFFTLDVIDVMILSRKEGKWKKLTVFIIILLAVLATLFLIFGILGIAVMIMEVN